VGHAESASADDTGFVTASRTQEPALSVVEGTGTPLAVLGTENGTERVGRPGSMRGCSRQLTVF
jgi:hypothetical protein